MSLRSFAAIPRTFLALLALVLLGVPVRGSDRAVQIRWLGHSAFLITSPGGVRVLTDPYAPWVGYPMTPVAADVVVITNNHDDHRNLKLVQGNPRVLYGLTLEGECTRLRARVGDVSFRVFPSWQDGEQGAQRGQNGMFLIDAGGVRILHTGNLGHELTPDQMAEMGPVDVLILPVGGIYTLDGHAAARVVAAMAPRVAIPMHYRTPALRVDLDPADKFLSHFPDHQVVRSLTLEPDNLPEPTRVYVLDYR